MGFTDNGEQALPLGLRSRPPGWRSHGWLDGPEVARLPALIGNLPSGILETAVHRVVKVKVKLLIAQLCLALFDPMGCSPPGSSVMEFSRPEYWNGLPRPPPGIGLRGSVLRPRGRTQVSLYHWATRASHWGVPHLQTHCKAFWGSQLITESFRSWRQQRVLPGGVGCWTDRAEPAPGKGSALEPRRGKRLPLSVSLRHPLLTKVNTAPAGGGEIFVGSRSIYTEL